MARILPSVPLVPKPPGTNTPLRERRSYQQTGLQPWTLKCVRWRITLYIISIHWHFQVREPVYFQDMMDYLLRIHWLLGCVTQINGGDGTLLPPCGITVHNSATTYILRVTHCPHRQKLLVVFWGGSTHSELHSLCQASWYFTGSSCRVIGSKSAESMYCKQSKQHRLEWNQPTWEPTGRVLYEHWHMWSSFCFQGLVSALLWTGINKILRVWCFFFIP